MGPKRQGKNEAKSPSLDMFDPVILESKTAGTAVLMLKSDEQDILVKVCFSLYKYAEKCDTNKDDLVKLGAVEPVFRLVQHEDRSVKTHACMVLGLLSSNSQARAMCRKLNCVPVISALLNPQEDVLVHEFATLCMMNMAKDYSGKTQLQSEDVLQPLVTMIESSDPDVQKNSAECIALLLQDFAAISLVRDLGAIQHLLALIQSEYPVIQDVALLALVQITNDFESRNELKQQGGIEKLLQFIRNNISNELASLALHILANCLTNIECTEELTQCRGFETLLQAASESTLNQVKQQAAVAIGRFFTHPEQKKPCPEMNVEKVLVGMLSIDHAGLQAAAAETLSIVAELPSCREVICDSDGVRLAVHLLESEDAVVRKYALLVLATMTRDSHDISAQVSHEGGIEPLVTLLADGIPDVMINAAGVLTNLITDNSLRAEILQSRAISILLEPLKSGNPQLQIHASLLVCALATDGEARLELQTSGAVEALVELLRSYSEEVRRTACWAVAICAADTSTAIELIKHGALEMLQELCLSIARRNSFAEVALETLLNNNLPAKYSLKGALSATDVVVDGFYDAGAAKAGVRLLCLEELEKQQVSDRLPVVVINFGKLQEDLADAASVKSDTADDQDLPKQKPGIQNKGISSPLAKHVQGSSGGESILSLPQEKAHSTVAGQLCHYLEETKHFAQNTENTRAHIQALARFVCEKMGGSVTKETLSSLGCELYLMQLKQSLNSNVVPLGLISIGTFTHRALLFKALVDKAGLQCSLVRGRYSRAWNEVLLIDKSGYQRAKSYIVDLMYNPGDLLAVDSPEAAAYCQL